MARALECFDSNRWHRFAGIPPPGCAALREFLSSEASSMSTKSYSTGPPPPPQSWYPPSVVCPQPLIRESNSHAAMSSAAGSGSGAPSRVNSSAGTSNGSGPFLPPLATSPAPAATMDSLNNKSVHELAEMLQDKKAYNAFLHSLEPVRQSAALLQELKQGNIDQARKNLEEEAKIAELKNQCAIIRTTELAVAREAFEEATRLERDVVESRSPARFVTMLQEAAAEVDEESETMHRMLLKGELDPAEFIPKYRSLRLLYHRRMLQRLAAVAPG